MKNEVIFSNLSNLSAYIAPADFSIERQATIICEQHYHDEVEFLYVHSGEFVCIVNDKEYICTEGDIIFINSRVPHYTRSNVKNTHTSMLQYYPFDIGETNQGADRYLSRFINISKKPIICLKNNDTQTQELKMYLLTVFKEYIEKRPSYELYAKAGIFAITAFLYRYDYLVDTSSFFNRKSITKLLPALDYIDKNYQRQITLEQISKFTNLDPYYFCRLFKKATNSTFTEYLNFVRVAKSEKRLSETTETISEIAYSLGFSSASYFNRIFKKYKGCTPTQYKKSKFSNQ